jgi:hypothetical protein
LEDGGLADDPIGSQSIDEISTKAVARRRNNCIFGWIKVMRTADVGGDRFAIDVAASGIDLKVAFIN